MPSEAILTRQLGKRYPGRHRLRSRGGGTLPDDPVALDDVSIEVPRGSGFGVVGRNGAGKSTLLRLVAGLARPSTGEVVTAGRVAALLELGSGLIDEWSGEANVRASLRLRGIAGQPADAALAFVEAFSELGARLTWPVRSYSAGMRLRLAYALAVSADPEVLVVDEILAVGDESFQRKCSLHVEEFLAGGGTLLLAAHNLYLVEKLCAQAVWLEAGRVKRAGGSRDVTAAYRHALETDTSGTLAGTRLRPRAGIELRAGTGTDALPQTSAAGDIPFGSSWWVEVAGLGTNESAHLAIERADGSRVAGIVVCRAGRFEVATPRLLPGTFVVRLAADARPGAVVLAEQTIVVTGDRRELGSMHLQHQWL